MTDKTPRVDAAHGLVEAGGVRLSVGEITDGEFLKRVGTEIQSAAASGGSTGTVTSIDMTVPPILAVSGNPITASGTLAVTLTTQSANKLFAGPASGSPTIPTFRTVTADEVGAVPTTRTITAGTGLSGGGNLSANRTINHSNSITPVTVFAANLTCDSTGHITATTGNSLYDYSGGLITNNAAPVSSVILQGVDLSFDSVNGTVYMLSNDQTSGKLYYIDRITDGAVLLASYASKRTQWSIYSPVSGLLYISYTNSFMSVNSATGAIVTAPITGVKADAGGAIRTSTGVIYTASVADAKMYRTDPATDTIVGAGVALTTFPTSAKAVAYCQSNDCMYISLQNGTVDRYDCAFNTITNITPVFAGGGNAGSCVYSSETDLIYVVNLTASTIKTITPNVNSVANTYSFPPGYTFSTGGQNIYEYGDYLYIGTQNTVLPYVCMLIFKKSSATFVGTIRNKTGAGYRGFGIAGVLTERVLYVMDAASQVGNSSAANLYPFRMP